MTCRPLVCAGLVPVPGVAAGPVRRFLDSGDNLRVIAGDIAGAPWGFVGPGGFWIRKCLVALDSAGLAVLAPLLFR